MNRIFNMESILTRTTLAQAARRLAFGSFGLAVIFSPWRLRWVIAARPAPPVYRDYTDFLFFIGDGFWLAAFGLWVLSLALQPRRMRLGPWFLSLPLAGLTLAGWLSVPAAIDPALAFYHGVRFTGLAALYLYTLNEVRDVRRIVLPAAIGAGLQAVVGVTQALTGSDLGLQILGEYALNPDWSGVSIVWAEGQRALRAYGLSDHPNLLGGLLAFSLVVVGAGVWRAPLRRRTVTGGVFVLIALGLFYTFSRAAWLAVSGGFGLMVVMALLSGSRRGFLAVRTWAGLLAAAGLVLLPFILHNLPFLGARFNAGGSFAGATVENQALGERTLLNRAANEIFAEHALTGTGLGTFPLALKAAYPDWPSNYQPAHLVLLDAAAEVGIFGALFYALAISVPFLVLFLRRKRLVFSPELWAATGLLLAVTLVGFFDYYTWLLVPGRFWAWMSWGLWGSAYLSAIQEDRYA